MGEHELKYFDEIERYLDGEMTEQERMLFEQRLIDEPELKMEYDVLSAVVKELSENKRRELKKMLSEADRELDNSESSSNSVINKEVPLLGKKFWKFAIAASVLFFVGLSVVWLLQQSESNREKLVAEYWQKDAGLPVLMGQSDAIKFDNAMSDYKAGNYKEALDLFKQVSVSDTVIYYTALCMNEINQDATAQFKSVAEQPNSVFHSKAKYYLLLLYIKADKNTEAKSLLSELLSDKSHPYYSLIENLSNEAYFKN